MGEKLGASAIIPFLPSNTLRKPVVSDELKPMKSRHRDREITPTVYTELPREETEF